MSKVRESRQLGTKSLDPLRTNLTFRNLFYPHTFDIFISSASSYMSKTINLTPIEKERTTHKVRRSLKSIQNKCILARLIKPIHITH